jgi:hypothetical protein
LQKKGPEKALLQTIPLPGADPEAEVTSVFERLELANLEFGLDWLSNLAATSFPSKVTNSLHIARDSGGLAALAMSTNIETGIAAALGNWYTSLYSPAVTAGDPTRLFAALFRGMANDGWASVALSPLAEDYPYKRHLHHALAAAGWRGIHEWSCFTNWYHNLETASYTDYLASRPSRVRNTIARKTRQFLADDKGSLAIVSSPPLLEQATRDYISVYDRSWKQKEPWPEFMPGLIGLAARRGWLRLGLAHYERRPIAAQIWLVANGTASIFKLAYDEKYKALSPGTVLSAHLMKHVIDQDGVATIDYLTGDDPYKKDWMSRSRERVGIAAFNPATLKGAIGLGEHSARRLAKRLTARL